MARIIKIETGESGINHAQFGSEIVRFTYDDSIQVYASVAAFPSREVMVKDCSDPESGIQNILALARGRMSPESGNANQVASWKTEWSVATH